ncbi:hypothetical protein O181_105259 [Austropuccinia psidii MF-1]|uniref:Tc1-like transposase DDE domain-containing protein n=1 Tax=Austropuccinia psidii MF-1 TaxID=1389203 RepID=A0A9Q3JP17_9BASI|nr:hypothetical protein [Austropuccinia psidii MF-1]
MGVPKLTVNDTIRWLQENGSCANCPKSGWPPLLNDADQQNLDAFIMQNQQANLNEILCSILSNASIQTLIKAVHDLGKQSCIAPKKPYLRQLDFNQRLTFVQQFVQWACIIWMDESLFQLGKKADQHERPTRFLDGTQTASTFIQQVYEPHLRLFYNFMVNAPYIRTRDCIGMLEYGTPIHTAQISNKWRATNQIDKLPWTAHLPDLHPIKNVWKLMETCVTKNHQPCTIDKLHEAIQSAWDDLSAAFFEKFLIGIHKQMEAVVECNFRMTRW